MNKVVTEVSKEQAPLWEFQHPTENNSVGFGNTVNYFLKEQNSGSFSFQFSKKCCLKTENTWGYETMCKEFAASWLGLGLTH